MAKQAPRCDNALWTCQALLCSCMSCSLLLISWSATQVSPSLYIVTSLQPLSGKDAIHSGV